MKRVYNSSLLITCLLILAFSVLSNISASAVEEDTAAPELDLSSLYFDTREIQYGEYNYLHARITDKSIIKYSCLVYTNIKNSAFMESSDGLYSAIFRGDQYGRYQVEAIEVQDAYDNAAFYVDKRFEEKYSWTSQGCEIRYADFSDLFFDVVQHSVHSHALILPRNLKTIDSKAFINLPAVDYVYIPSSVINIADDAFDEDIKIIAPSGSYSIEWANNHGFQYSIED